MKYILFLLLIVTIPGCADRRSAGEGHAISFQAPPKMEEPLYVMADEAVVEGTPVLEELEAIEEIEFTPPKADATIALRERKLIKTGSIDFEVSDIETTKKSINNLVKETGGYTSSEHEQHEYDGPRFEQVVRIPSGKLEDFVLKISGLAKKINSKDMSTSDVSEEFVDIEARLITKKDLEKNYREILRKAKTVKEMLEVERELEDVRGQIESMEGRLQYLKSQVAFSTLTLTYFQLVPVVEEETDFGDRVAASLGNGWFNVVEITLDVIAAWPGIIIGSIAALFMYLRVRGWIRKRRLVTQVVN